jgi:hypothetical protein
LDWTPPCPRAIACGRQLAVIRPRDELVAGKARKKRKLSVLNTDVFTQIPSARHSPATNEKPGDFRDRGSE